MAIYMVYFPATMFSGDTALSVHSFNCAIARPWPRSRDHLTNGPRHVTIRASCPVCIEVKRTTELVNSTASTWLQFPSLTE